VCCVREACDSQHTNTRCTPKGTKQSSLSLRVACLSVCLCGHFCQRPATPKHQHHTRCRHSCRRRPDTSCMTRQISLSLVSACLSVCEPPVCNGCTDERATHSREQASHKHHTQTDGSPNTAPHSDSLCSQSANRPLLCLSVCLSVRFPPPPTHRPTHSRQQTADTQNPTIQSGTIKAPP